MANSHLYRLENSWRPQGGQNGSLTFALFNLGSETLSNFRLAYTSLTRCADPAAVENATLLRRNANFHEFSPPDGVSVGPGGSWTFTVAGLRHPARHCTDGAKSAYINIAEGNHVPVAVSDLLLEGMASEPPPILMPEGRADQPFALQPWPADIAVEAGDQIPVTLYPAESTNQDDRVALSAALSLFHRLFEADHAPFSLLPSSQGRKIEFVPDNDRLGHEAYRLEFISNGVRLLYADPSGRFYGLISLAQLLNSARRKPNLFRFPISGHISDRPRYGWRACHLDVSRQFYPTADVARLIDIMAWLKLNTFHWHLSDDEAWRLEIKAYPELTTTGVLRGPDEPLLPQLGNGVEPVGGFYTQSDVKHLVAHAADLHIEVLPEIDIPGHSTATLTALPHLADSQEPPESYHSVQGFPNNALNPAVESTYEFLGKVFDEIVELFPSSYIHIGGDEVADGSWLASPLAKELMAKEGISGTHALQSYFMRRIKTMLDKRGKKLAGWNEVAHGGGVDPTSTLLMAWRGPELGVELAREGYDVVMTPGQAYYLDMAQAEAFQEPGAGWAGFVPPEHTYNYEAEGDFPSELKSKMKGIQACIWSEHILSRGYFNHLVFPRLSAVAEAAWTPKANKNWLRFAAIESLNPRL
ncbi:hypothetical protein NKR23_g6547 [Pleurostoma richardsiae]|uniref:beta-N-acetylhexosaminidase n=1 Tax=Pleurostoma richardsiae TaxID=41990 RepID=A0AA38VNZ1_9PEZI|nr:hypothetical protein NKR23_g6547 [Pleurostoma richardsiae]